MSGERECPPNDKTADERIAELEAEVKRLTSWQQSVKWDIERIYNRLNSGYDLGE